MHAKHSIHGSYLYYFIYKVLFLLLAQISLAQEITQKTVWSMSPNRGARRGTPGDWGYEEEMSCLPGRGGGGWMGAPPPGAGITQGVTPRQGSHEGEGVSQAGGEA